MSTKKPEAAAPEQEAVKNIELTPELEALINEKVAAVLKAAKEKEVHAEPSAPVSNEEKLKAQKEKEVNDWLSQKVTVRLMKDSGLYKHDVFVAVNGKGWLIKRGVPVQIPRYVALALEQSMTQDEKTAMLIEQKTAEFAEKSKELTE